MQVALDASSSGNAAWHLFEDRTICGFLHLHPRLGYPAPIMVRVVEVQPGTELLTKIQELWRRHSDTLGFFPEGAFDEYARKRCVLAAVDQEDGLLGYTLFRTTHRRKASIAHLCVDPAVRARGVARRLFEGVKSLVRDSDDIMVRCRRDFAANALWPRLGFIPVDEEHGRGKDPQVVTIWRYELNRLPLLAAMDKPRDDVMPVVIDANVFYDLDPQGGPGTHEESKALAADWLGGFIELCLTEEIYNEINRREDPAHRTRQRLRVEQFRVLHSDKAREEQVRVELEQQFPSWTSESARSDMRQLTRAVAAGVTYFVTRDGRVRDQAESLYEQYGLVVVSPYELVLRFDELRREDEYRPKRFISVGLQATRPRPEDLDRIADLIHVGQPSPEPRRRTTSRVRDLLASPERFDLTCITSDDGSLLAAYAIERVVPELLRVPLFAAADSALGRTAARHFAQKLVSLAAGERRRVVEVAEGTGGRRIEEALFDAGFSKEGNLWVKLVIPLVAGSQEIAAEVARISSQHPQTMGLAERIASYLRAERGAGHQSPSPAYIERALWPAKIAGVGVNCFAVSIRPQWAEQLFDTELAKETLFGANALLAMKLENAYYRAARPAVLTAPARVLWYVKKDPDYCGSMAIRACSSIDEVIVAKPKDAYRRFQRLGVYRWDDVFEIAEQNLDNDVMAFQFSATELFSRPIHWDSAREVLQRHGHKARIQSPVKITEACFLELYQLGMGGA